MAYPFVQARWYSPGGNTPVNRIVIHDMEYPETHTAAEDVAKFFQRLPADRKASAHYCIDDDSIVQCVKETDVAYHAPPNTGSIGLEHAGRADQGDQGWRDAFSEAMLRRSAALTADLCTRHSIPAVWLTAADLLNNKRGVTSHANVSAAWHRTNHTDPGPTFPISHYMELVRAAMSGVAIADSTAVDPAPTTQEEDMAAYAVACPAGSTTPVGITTPGSLKWKGGYLSLAHDGPSIKLRVAIGGGGHARLVVEIVLKDGMDRQGIELKAGDTTASIAVPADGHDVSALVEITA